MTASMLGATIGRRYVESYRHSAEEATHSAFDLSRLDDLVEGVDLLARRLLARFKSAALAPAVHGLSTIWLMWSRTLGHSAVKALSGIASRDQHGAGGFRRYGSSMRGMAAYRPDIVKTFEHLV